jgi:hypothetical protein
MHSENINKTRTKGKENNNNHKSSLIDTAGHKPTEGRAPVWVSEFTTKAAALQGDSEDFAAG